MTNIENEIIVDGELYTPDAIIFDVDGTIWDSTGIVTDAWNKALIDTGHEDIQVTADRLKGLFGLPMLDIMKDIMPGADISEIRRFETVCNEYEEDYIKAQCGVVYDKIDEVIQKLSQNYKVIIVSNCQSGYIELVIGHLKLEDYITDYVCPGDSGLLKADNILLMCEKHNIKKPVYVGDTQMDANACKQANVPFVFVSYGFGKVEEYAAKADKPMDLLKIF